MGMPAWLGFRFRYIFVCILWIVLCDYLIHGWLGLPRTTFSYYLYGLFACLVLSGLQVASYTWTVVILFLMPWLDMLVYAWTMFDGMWRGLICSLLFAGLGSYLFYIKRSLLDSRQEILATLDRLRRGHSDRACSVFFHDERGRVIRNLNRWLSFVRERARLTQFISAEEWQTLSANNPRQNTISQDCWVISLVFRWGGQGLALDETMLENISAMCVQLGASINRFHAGYGELIIQQESGEHEKNALILLPELRSVELGENQYLYVVIRRTFLKRGVVRHPNGYSFRCVGLSLMEDANFLFSQTDRGIHLWVHSGMSPRASQMFHLEELKDGYSYLRSDKDLEYHIEKLQSPKVEERLVSIRVVSIQRNSMALEPLLALLSDISPRVRIATATALGMLVNPDNEERIGEAFLKALEAEWNQDIRASLVMALGKLRKASLIKPLYQLLSDENDRVRANAVEAVGRCMGRGAVVRYVEKLIKDPNNRTRANAAMAIWLVGDKRGFKVLVEMAASDDPLISCSGLYGLGEIFTNDSIKISLQFIADPVKFYFKERALFKDALKICIQQVMNPHPLVERNAVIALGKIRSNQAVEILRNKFLSTARLSLKQLIINSLLQLEEFELVTNLRKELVEIKQA